MNTENAILLTASLFEGKHEYLIFCLLLFPLGRGDSFFSGCGRLTNKVTKLHHAAHGKLLVPPKGYPQKGALLGERNKLQVLYSRIFYYHVIENQDTSRKIRCIL